MKRRLRKSRRIVEKNIRELQGEKDNIRKINLCINESSHKLLVIC